MEKAQQREFIVDQAHVHILQTKLGTSVAAATEAASILRSSLAQRGWARIIVGTGNSQDDMVNALVQASELDWSCVEIFHMDEYVGMSADHPASFRRWLKTHLVDIVHPRKAQYLQGDAPNLAEECARYTALLHAAPIDICFIGFGENGHIAFNDPGVADFQDPLAVKRVAMDGKMPHATGRRGTLSQSLMPCPGRR